MQHAFHRDCPPPLAMRALDEVGHGPGAVASICDQSGRRDELLFPILLGGMIPTFESGGTVATAHVESLLNLGGRTQRIMLEVQQTRVIDAEMAWPRVGRVPAQARAMTEKPPLRRRCVVVPEPHAIALEHTREFALGQYFWRKIVLKVNRPHDVIGRGDAGKERPGILDVELIGIQLTPPVARASFAPERIEDV